MRKPHITSDITNKLSRTVLGERRLFDVATRTEEIHPPSEFHSPKAIFNPADLAKITGVGMGTTMDTEMARIEASVSKHQGTYACELRDVVLMDGALYKPRFKWGISYREKLVGHAGLIDAIDDAGVLAQSWLGSRYFGHWIRDDIPLATLAARLGKPVGIERPLTPQQQGYARLFGVDVSVLPRLAHLGKITVLSDAYYNEGKIARWRAMRDRVAACASGKRYKGVMLLRGGTGEARMLLNEEQIAERLEALGFYVVNPAKVDLDTFLANAAGAEVVVGVEGSQLANGFVCMKNGGSMLVLQPPFRFNNIYKDVCDAMQVKYGFVVGDAQSGGFVISPDAVEAMLDRLRS
jgi:hypothetical protein